MHNVYNMQYRKIPANEKELNGKHKIKGKRNHKPEPPKPFSPGWCYQPVLKGLGGFWVQDFFPLILCFPFNSFSFAGILRYYILYTLCIYINRISRRTDHIYIYIIECLTQHSHIHMYIYNLVYIYIYNLSPTWRHYCGSG